MLPSINNIICVVYDEPQSNMKGVLLYVVHPSDAQLLRDDFRIVKQASIAHQFQPTNYSSPFENRYSSPLDNRYSAANDSYRSKTNQTHTPLPANKSPISNDLYPNTFTIRHQSPRRIIFSRENETNLKPTFVPTLPQLSYTPHKSVHYNEREEYDYRQHSSPRRNRTVQSPSKRSNETGTKRQRKHRSRSPEKQAKPKLSFSNSSHELLQERSNQHERILAQQQQWLIQQQIATWQSSQQTPFIPMGIYNRYEAYFH